MWPFRKEPKPDEIDAAIKSAERDMEPEPWDELDEIDEGTWVFGNLLYIGSGLFIDPAEIVIMILHPKQPKIILRNGCVYTLSKHGVKLVAEQIIRMQKGSS